MTGKKSRKAQIKMFETVGILVVFFVLLAIAGVIYFKVQSSNFQKEKIRVSHIRTFAITQKATFLPELDCNFLSVQTENCFDTEKLIAFKKYLEDSNNKEIYAPYFGMSKIAVKKIWALPSFTFQDTVLYERKPSSEKLFAKLTTYNPVLLYDPKTKVYSFGVVEAEYYAEE